LKSVMIAYRRYGPKQLGKSVSAMEGPPLRVAGQCFA
jgi:hypothetical protein